MANLTVRNLDETIVAKLKQQATKHGRSLEAEVREILRRSAGRPTVEEIMASVERIAAMTPDVPQTDSADIIREDRER